MTLIVADTGPVNYLVQIDCVDVLPELAETVVLPVSVLAELRSAHAPAAVRVWAEHLPDWIVLREPGLLIPAQPDLSLADRTAIALAMELNALLLMDDRKARRSASEQMVATIGTVGILEVAAAKGLISLSAALAQLQATNMFLSGDLVAQALQRDSLRRAGA